MKRFLIVLVITGFLLLDIWGIYRLVVRTMQTNLDATLAHQSVIPLSLPPKSDFATRRTHRAVAYMTKRNVGAYCDRGQQDTQDCQHWINTCKNDKECFQMVTGYERAYHALEYYKRL